MTSSPAPRLEGAAGQAFSWKEKGSRPPPFQEMG